MSRGPTLVRKSRFLDDLCVAGRFLIPLTSSRISTGRRLGLLVFFADCRIWRQARKQANGKKCSGRRSVRGTRLEAGLLCPTCVGSLCCRTNRANGKSFLAGISWPARSAIDSNCTVCTLRFGGIPFIDGMACNANVDQNRYQHTCQSITERQQFCGGRV